MPPKVVDDGTRVVTFIKFATGKVESIAYQIPRLGEVNEFDRLEPRIIVSLRPITTIACFSALPRRLPLLFGYLLKNGVHFAIALDAHRVDPLESGLREVIHALKEEEYLNRHQEIAAYVEFGIPYRQGVKG